MGTFEFFEQGGLFMWGISGLSVFALAIILERYYVLNVSYKFKKAFFESVIRYIQAGELKRAVGLCYRTSHPLAGVIIELLKNYKQDRETMESAASISLQKVVPNIRKRTNYLQMIGNVATLVGLLGTIQGLILSFSSLSSSDAASKAELLADGISTAMNTTAFGLMVAVPCIIFFTVLSTKENAILLKYEETVSEVIHIMAFEWKTRKGGTEAGADDDLVEIFETK